MFYPKLYNIVDEKVHWMHRVYMTIYVMCPLLLLVDMTTFNLVMCLITPSVVANWAYPIVIHLWMIETVAVYWVVYYFQRLFWMKYPDVEAVLTMGHQPPLKTVEIDVKKRAEEMAKDKGVMTTAVFSCSWIETYAYLMYVFKNLHLSTKGKVYTPADENNWTAILAVSMHSSINVRCKILVMVICYSVYVYAPQDWNFWDSIDFTEAFERIKAALVALFAGIFAGRAQAHDDIPKKPVETDEEDPNALALAELCRELGLCAFEE
jgi:hypothetical protein